MIKRFIHYYKPHRKLFFADMFCALLVAICDLFYPMIAKNIINDYVPNRNLRLLLVWAVALVCIYLLKAGLNYFIQYYGHIVGVRMQSDMRRDMFQKLQKLPFSYFDENKTGTVMSRMINDLMDISELAHHGPENLFLSLILLVGSFVILCTINPLLTLIVYAALPFIIFFTVKMRRDMHIAFKRTREEIAEVNANIENAISGIRVSRAYTADKQETEKFELCNGRFVQARSAAYRVMARFFSGMDLCMDMLYVIVLVTGGIFFFQEWIDVGEFAVFLLYINMFLNPVKKLIQFFEQFQNGMSGFERFEQIMTESEEPITGSEIELPKLSGDIDFRHVNFRYKTDNSDQSLVLKDLSLHIPQGKTIALVGPSGGGKTTLCHLIPRFYEISAGSITIGEHDIREISRYALRKNIGIVAQDVFLFTGTVRDNIAYGKPDASEEEIISAAKKANIHDTVMTMENGYDTYIGERGVKLSGGQKQRISIARAFLKNPPILILDEATSALDNATEMMIQKSLEQLSQNRTSIIVAHRLSTIKNADEIVVITDDGIKEQGTHQQLLDKGGIYAELYAYQFAESSLQ
ncbi:MAG: ABC transporter ATP-binding protein [Clostridiales bacterium]|mgnify:FL=1|nr:ABC transporter ATP-binding protein [Clostridiales bacterium]